eukprot:gene1094-1185_t
MQTNAVSPLKVMVFVDGTWLYYSLVAGRGNEKGDPLRRKLGANWQSRYSIEWAKFPKLIADNLSSQLHRVGALRPDVEISRTTVFTSLRADTSIMDPREMMLSQFHRANFDVHRFLTKNTQEKCVDISLAVEMLYLSTVNDAFDIAVLVSGDKDFVPVLEKTRMLAKRVAICSMRGSCNNDLCNNENTVRDFDMIWLDDYIEELYVPKHPLLKGKDFVECTLIETIVDIIKSARKENEGYPSYDLGRGLLFKMVAPNMTAFQMLRNSYSNLRNFLEQHDEFFTLINMPVLDDGSQAYGVALKNLTARSVVVTPSNEPSTTSISDQEIKDVVYHILEAHGGSLFSRDLGRALNRIMRDGASLLSIIKSRHAMLRFFLMEHDDAFRINTNVRSIPVVGGPNPGFETVAKKAYIPRFPPPADLPEALLRFFDHRLGGESKVEQEEEPLESFQTVDSVLEDDDHVTYEDNDSQDNDNFETDVKPSMDSYNDQDSETTSSLGGIEDVELQLNPLASKGLNHLSPKLTLKEIKERLKLLGLSTVGNKDVLLKRLEEGEKEL